MTPSLSDQIRAAVRERVACSGETYAELAEQVGIHKSQMSRFLAGESGLETATLDRLAAHLGLTLRPTRPRRARPRP